MRYGLRMLESKYPCAARGFNEALKRQASKHNRLASPSYYHTRWNVVSPQGFKRTVPNKVRFKWLPGKSPGCVLLPIERGM